MIVKTKNPIEYQDNNTTNIETRGGYDGEDVGGFVSFEGDEFIPFDGETELASFMGADGETYHYSFNNDEYYNAKGAKIKKFFSKEGFFGKEGKLRKGLKELKGKIKTRRATIASNIQARRDARKVKKGAKKLLEIEKSNAKLRGDVAKINPIEEKDDISLNAPQPSPKEDKKLLEETPLKEETTKEQQQPISVSKFYYILREATAKTPPENILIYQKKQYDDEGYHDNVEFIDDGKGGKMFVLNVQPKNVVAVTAEDGKIDYYQKNDVEGEGMTLTIKILIGVGAVVALGLITFLIVKRKK